MPPRHQWKKRPHCSSSSRGVKGERRERLPPTGPMLPNDDPVAVTWPPALTKTQPPQNPGRRAVPLLASRHDVWALLRVVSNSEKPPRRVCREALAAVRTKREERDFHLAVDGRTHERSAADSVAVPNRGVENPRLRETHTLVEFSGTTGVVDECCGNVADRLSRTTKHITANEPESRLVRDHDL